MEFYNFNLIELLIIIFVANTYLGRYSPVRRASEGSRNPQIQGPFQECQQLQKGLAQQRNNYLVTPNPPQENSVSLPGRFYNRFSLQLRVI